MTLHLDHDCIPGLAWPSMLSLDALIVAVVWQQLLMHGFCHHSSTWPECVSLGATVWLIYVADRLLDAARLDLSAPHTLRHEFYLHHRRAFLTVWIVVLVATAFIVTHCLPHELLRGGLMLAAAVLVYGASVHFSPMRSQAMPPIPLRTVTGARVPKEIRIGILFAMGVSLSVWTTLIASGASGRMLASLALTTCVLSLLFAGNCTLVAQFERDLDRAQSFASIVTQPNATQFSGRSSLALPLLGMTMVVPVVLLLMPMPMPVLLTAGTSAFGLAAIALGFRPSPPVQMAGNPRATFDVRGAWVDAAVWAPPLTVLLLGPC